MDRNGRLKRGNDDVGADVGSEWEETREREGERERSWRRREENVGGRRERTSIDFGISLQALLHSYWLAPLGTWPFYINNSALYRACTI